MKNYIDAACNSKRCNLLPNEIAIWWQIWNNLTPTANVGFNYTTIPNCARFDARSLRVACSFSFAKNFCFFIFMTLNCRDYCLNFHQRTTTYDQCECAHYWRWNLLAKHKSILNCLLTKNYCPKTSTTLCVNATRNGEWKKRKSKSVSALEWNGRMDELAIIIISFDTSSMMYHQWHFASIPSAINIIIVRLAVAMHCDWVTLSYRNQPYYIFFRFARVIHALPSLHSQSLLDCRKITR